MAELDPVETLASLTDVVRTFGLRTHKSLGQNFLLDLNITRKIARSAGLLDGYTVIEIGPGPGGLTRGLLLEGASRVVAIEMDRRCVEALAPLQEAAGERLEILQGDALRVDLSPFMTGPTKIVANLPYNIATPLIMGWLALLPRIESFTLMLQKEVGARFEAAPNTKAYGRVSVLTQWQVHVTTLFDVPPHVFSPPPKVMSSVVHFEARQAPLYPADPCALDRLLRRAFSHRRKVLRANLKALSSCIEDDLAACGITPNARAQEVGLEAFCGLARRLEGALLQDTSSDDGPDDVL
ncbi:MAG: 16S rRNA (adenine(1518)-N(6)/adenine(1519)-N(6))-dimethyltransferase RsmA [Alphaproteobacteria bacterium]|nr:16S rRNA (adenine(1518)-N(6)/adenine(1519)-N(6))-dimethyltransferase RsmA [Alphaproteobacteria bacterium]